MAKLLIAENNIDFVYSIVWHFKQKGFEVFSSPKGEEVIELYKQNLPDVVLLDINLDGDIDGKEIARTIRSIDKKTPIIFMSGESKSPEDVVEGFNIGCNFFLKKPVVINEIEVHIKSALNKQNTNSLYTFSNCSFDSDEKIIIGVDKTEHLSSKENKVLLCLAENQNQIVSIKDICVNVWNNKSMDNALRNTINSLRKKLVNNGLQITTVKNKGYYLSEANDNS